MKLLQINIFLPFNKYKRQTKRERKDKYTGGGAKDINKQNGNTEQNDLEIVPNGYLPRSFSLPIIDLKKKSFWIPIEEDKGNFSSNYFFLFGLWTKKSDEL